MEQKEFFQAVQPNYPVDFSAVATLIKGKYRETFARILRTAEDAAANRFAPHLRWDLEQAGRPVEFGEEIDWLYQPGEDSEFTFALNRMKFWVCMGQAYQVTGEEKYAQAFARQLCHWVDCVPREDAACEKAWRTLEAGIRMAVWSKAIGYFKGSPALTADVLERYLSSMTAHAEYIMSVWNSYHLMSSQGVMASHGLFAAGCALPPSERTGEYQREAVRRLYQEMKMQVYPDGMQWEQSPMYHNQVLRCCLDVVLRAQRAGFALPRGFEETVFRMARASLAWQKPDGCEPLVGDSEGIDQRDLMTLAAAMYHDSELKFAGYPTLDYDTLWELGAEDAAFYAGLTACQPDCRDFALGESGNFIFRSDWGEDAVWARFHCGTLGAGQGHADQLHFDIAAYGQDILTAPGRIAYGDSPSQREFRNPDVHSSILVDGGDFCLYKDSWECAKLSRAVNQHFYTDGQYGYTEGGHLGYYGRGVFVNRRMVYLKPDVFVIIDEFYASGTHQYQQFFYWGEGGTVRQEKGVTYWQGKTACASLRLISAQPMLTELRQSRAARRSNAVQENTVLETVCAGEGFVSVFTVISVDRAGAPGPLTAEKLPVRSSFKNTTFGDRQVEALRITKDRRSWVLVVAHEEYAGPTDTFCAGGCKGFGGVVVFADDETEIGAVLAR